jgi:predicted amidophosphoribosyltransferase
MGEKKCPYCGEWSTWNQDLRDTCDHCGKILGGKDLEYQEKRQAQKQANEEQWIFYINESDNEFIKALKKTGNFFYVIYMAILTFMAWVIAFFPG